jgi:hypothetical protein
VHIIFSVGSGLIPSLLLTNRWPLVGDHQFAPTDKFLARSPAAFGLLQVLNPANDQFRSREFGPAQKINWPHESHRFRFHSFGFLATVSTSLGDRGRDDPDDFRDNEMGLASSGSGASPPGPAGPARRCSAVKVERTISRPRCPVGPHRRVQYVRTLHNTLDRVRNL